VNRAAHWAAVHRKALVAFAGSAVTLAAGVWGTGNKYVALAILICTVLGVNGIPNQPAGPPKAPPPARAARTGNPGTGDQPPPQVLSSGDMPAPGP
jgi:hypothetical protein